jgi:hypothetical protein
MVFDSSVELLGNSDLNEAILSAAIRHSSGGWNPGGESNNLDTGLRRYDVKLFLEIESLILGPRRL